MDGMVGVFGGNYGDCVVEMFGWLGLLVWLVWWDGVVSMVGVVGWGC